MGSSLQSARISLNEDRKSISHEEWRGIFKTLNKISNLSTQKQEQFSKSWAQWSSVRKANIYPTWSWFHRRGITFQKFPQTLHSSTNLNYIVGIVSTAKHFVTAAAIHRALSMIISVSTSCPKENPLLFTHI